MKERQRDSVSYLACGHRCKRWVGPSARTVVPLVGQPGPRSPQSCTIKFQSQTSSYTPEGPWLPVSPEGLFSLHRIWLMRPLLSPAPATPCMLTVTHLKGDHVWSSSALAFENECSHSELRTPHEFHSSLIHHWLTTHLAYSMGVRPLASRAPGSAPYTANSSTCAVCPAWAATCIGQLPFSCGQSNICTGHGSIIEFFSLFVPHMLNNIHTGHNNIIMGFSPICSCLVCSTNLLFFFVT